MKTIPFADIIVSADRQRRVFSEQKAEQLQASILSKGLLHPIVLRNASEAIGGMYTLVCGERRLRAMQAIYENGHFFKCDGTDVPADEIPYILLSYDKDKILIIEAELEENILREDLTWQEVVASQNELHLLRQEQNPKQTFKETAKEVSPRGVRWQAQKISRAVVTAKFLDDPEVARARNEEEAFSIASRKIQREFEGLQFRRKKQNVAHRLHIMNAETYFEKVVGEEKFDCIITDPPYGLNAHYFGSAAQKGHTYKDTVGYAIALNKTIIDETFKCAKDQCHFYLFCDLAQFVLLRDFAERCGWEVRRVPLIWYKGSRGHLDTGKSVGYKRSYEAILSAWKGKAKFRYLYLDTFLKQTPDLVKVHAAQKPVSLYTKLLSHVCGPGEKILDVCCGSGTVFRAAVELKLVATGVEPDQEMAKEAEHARTLLPEEIYHG